MGNRSRRPQYSDRENPNSLGGGGRLLLRAVSNSDRRQGRFLLVAIVGVLALPVVPLAIAGIQSLF